MDDHWEKELKEAVWNNRPDIITLAIENGADVNWIGPGSMGRTQLFTGIIHKRFDAVKCLLEEGADPNIVDDSGKTPLQIAKAGGLEDFTTLLEAHGAK